MNDSTAHNRVHPLVSVVTATCPRDRLDHLLTAVESILSQTWKDLELLVVFDGPAAPSARAALQDLAEKDPRLQLLTLPQNAGAGAARNAAIAAARGEYVAILDADDIAMPERIERQVTEIQVRHVDLVGSWYRVINEQGTTIDSRKTPIEPALLRQRLAFFNPIAHSSVLLRTQLLRRYPYPESLRFGEDYRLWVTLALNGHSMHNLPEYLLAYRRDAGFLRRRTGWSLFRTDLTTKLAALPLLPWYVRPFAALAALLISACRLVPVQVLTALYRLRALL